MQAVEAVQAVRAVEAVRAVQAVQVGGRGANASCRVKVDNQLAKLHQFPPVTPSSCT